MFSWLLGSKCAICTKKAAELRKYFDDEGNPIKVCEMCVLYAERRAFKKR